LDRLDRALRLPVLVWAAVLVAQIQVLFLPMGFCRWQGQSKRRFFSGNWLRWIF
jgi:hypothetical protein